MKCNKPCNAKRVHADKTFKIDLTAAQDIVIRPKRRILYRLFLAWCIHMVLIGIVSSAESELVKLSSLGAILYTTWWFTAKLCEVFDATITITDDSADKETQDD